MAVVVVMVATAVKEDTKLIRGANSEETPVVVTISETTPAEATLSHPSNIRIVNLPGYRSDMLNTGSIPGGIDANIRDPRACRDENADEYHVFGDRKNLLILKIACFARV